jgi:phage head maturation protease
MSFGFRTITDEWRMDESETIRELHEVELFDVSPVTFPAYPQTDVSTREIRSFFEEKLRFFNQKPATNPDFKAFLQEKRRRLLEIY